MDRQILTRKVVSVAAVVVLMLLVITAAGVTARVTSSTGVVKWTPDGVLISALISALARDQVSPRIISDEAGGAIVVWEHRQPAINITDIYAQRVNSEGIELWMANGVPVSAAAFEQENPRLVSDGQDGAIIAWEDARWEGPKPSLYAQRVYSDGQVAWTPNGVVVSWDGWRPDLLSDGQGGAIIVWAGYEVGNDASSDIYAHRIDGNGMPVWPSRVVVCGAPGIQNRPRIESDGAGGAIIAWEDERSGTDYDIYAQRIGGDGTTMWATNGVTVSAAGEWQGSGLIVSDGAGGAILTWRDYRNVTPDDPYNCDVYAQRVYSDGTLAWIWPSGSSPTTTYGITITAASDTQFPSSVVTDGAGGAIISWQHLSDEVPVTARIYAQRVNSDGSLAWATNGITISATTDAQEGGRMTSDGTGGAIVTWGQGTFMDWMTYDLYAQRLDANGNLLWGDNGIIVSAAANEQSWGEITTDGAGGAIIAWDDYRSGTDYDIYAQRVGEEEEEYKVYLPLVMKNH